MLSLALFGKKKSYPPFVQALCTYLTATLIYVFIPLMFTSGFSHVQNTKSALTLKELPYPSIQQVFRDTFSQASDFLMDSCSMETCKC